jgi:hypothetical protein
MKNQKNLKNLRNEKKKKVGDDKIKKSKPIFSYFLNFKNEKN